MYTMVQAGSMGVPFVPTLGYAGSDVVSRRPEDFKIVQNPFAPEEKVVVARAIRADVGLFHAKKADRAGNVLVRKGGEDLLLAQASRRAVFTVEEIVDHVEEDDPDGWLVPSIHVMAVVHAPHGAHPTAAPGYYRADDARIVEYVAAASSDESFAAYLEKYVFGVEDHAGYLQVAGLGKARERVAP